METPYNHILQIDGQAWYAEQLAAAVSRLRMTVFRVSSGAAARAYLLGLRKYSNRTFYPLPNLIVLSLLLPDEHGYRILGWFRNHPNLCRIPTVVHSSWDHPAAAYGALALGAKAFVPKDPRCERLLDLLPNILELETQPLQFAA